MPRSSPKNIQFRADFGVFVCDHVKAGAAVLQVVRDFDGDWQFSCGDPEDENADLHLVAVGDVIAKDASLADAVVLEPGQGIERAKTYKEWESFAIEAE